MDSKNCQIWDIFVNQILIIEKCKFRYGELKANKVENKLSNCEIKK